MESERDRVTVSARGLATLWGAVFGLLAFAVVAAVWRAGQLPAAHAAAEGLLLASLVSMAVGTVVGRPARMRRARVPLDHPMPHAWWPATTDPVPALVICAGTPVAAGAVAALLLFR